MDILILDNWLKEFLETEATSEDFAKYLSLSGPTVDRTNNYGKKDKLFEIEVTTNRVDAMSVYGIAREAATILPLYKIKANLKPLPQYSKPLPKTGPKLTLKSDPKLTKRLMGVVIEDIKNWETPKWMKERLESAGMRSINSVVDITNYVMHEVGHPCHVFDYDKIPNKKIVVRESKKGEKVTSFDGKTYKLSGGDIVFDDGDGNIIDLPGIIGTKNSVVNKKTKRVLFFFDTNDAKRIRKTSMELAIRTNAAALNEKGVDPELAEIALKRGLILFEEICKAKIVSPIYDVYHKPYVPKIIKFEKQIIDNILGIDIKISDIKKILTSLGFDVKDENTNLEIKIPSFRANDINIPEDIVEEVARLYGYQNIKGELMPGRIPAEVYKTSYFEWEKIIKDNLIKLGGVEVLTFSLVSKKMTDKNSLKISNPLGSDTEYLRSTLKHSLLEVSNINIGNSDKYHIFETSNVFAKNKNNLPKEEMTLGGIFVGYEYFEAKGILETLLKSLNIEYKNNFDEIMPFEIIKTNIFYYEAKVDNLIKNAHKYGRFQALPKYPAQVEDITIEIVGKPVGEILTKIINFHKNIVNAELTDVYENNYTFRIYYQDSKKTLTDKEVEKIREKLLKSI